MRLSLLTTTLVAALAALPAAAGTRPGGGAVTSAEYHLAARIDQTVAPIATELWAVVTRPKTLGSAKLPLVVLLHGNHGTCGHFVAGVPGRVDDDTTYTYSGTCPTGYVVSPSHLGYQYLAEKLAAYGYIVVSINADRGVNGASGVDGDDGLNLRRGRLVLRHLQQLSAWARKGGSPLGFDLSVIDFTHLGLMGHSRGGEGMLAAIAQYNDTGSIWPAAIATPIHFDGVFEIAPVDGQTDRTFYANNVPWALLMGSCDGDVYDFEGARVYDRTVDGLAEKVAEPKSVMAAWGASHNFYNTQWQQPEAGAGCAGPGNTPLFSFSKIGSAQQRATALTPFIGFMRAYVGAATAPDQANLLDPAFPLPTRFAKVTTYERAFSPSAKAGDLFVADDISPIPKGETVSGITFTRGTVDEHDPTLTAASIRWTAAGGALQVKATPPAGFDTLDIRVSLAGVCGGSSCGADPLDKGDTADFSVALLLADGTLGPAVRLSTYGKLTGPSAGPYGNPHMVLQTVRIPLADLGLPAGTAPTGVKLAFDQTATGAIVLTEIRLSHGPGTGLALQRAANAATHPFQGAPRQPRTLPAGRILAVQAGRDQTTDDVAIALESPVRLEVRDSLLTLQIGGQRITRADFPDGRTDRPVFHLSRASYDALPAGAAVTLLNGADRQAYGAVK